MTREPIGDSATKFKVLRARERLGFAKRDMFLNDAASVKSQKVTLELDESIIDARRIWQLHAAPAVYRK